METIALHQGSGLPALARSLTRIDLGADFRRRRTLPVQDFPGGAVASRPPAGHRRNLPSPPAAPSAPVPSTAVVGVGGTVSSPLVFRILSLFVFLFARS